MKSTPQASQDQVKTILNQLMDIIKDHTSNSIEIGLHGYYSRHGSHQEKQSFLPSLRRAISTPSEKHDNLTPLQYAIKLGRLSYVRELLEFKPDLRLKTSDGKSLLDLVPEDPNAQRRLAPKDPDAGPIPADPHAALRELLQSRIHLSKPIKKSWER